MNHLHRLRSVLASTKTDLDSPLFVSSHIVYWNSRPVPLAILTYIDGVSVYDLSAPEPVLAYNVHLEEQPLAVTPLDDPSQTIDTPSAPQQSAVSFQRPAILIASQKGPNVLLEVHPLCGSSPVLIPNSIFSAPQPENYTDIQLFSSRHAIVFSFSHHITIFCPSTLQPLKQVSLPGLPLSFKGRWLTISSAFSDDQQKSSNNLSSSAPISHFLVSTTTSVVKTIGSRAAQFTGHSPAPPSDSSDPDGVYGVSVIDVVASVQSSSALPTLVGSAVTHARPVLCATFCPRGFRLLIADKHCRLLSLINLLPTPHLESCLERGATPAKPVSMSFSHDHRWCAALTSHGTVHLFSSTRKSVSQPVEASLRLRHSIGARSEEDKQGDGRRMFIAILPGEDVRTYRVVVYSGTKIYSHLLSENNPSNVSSIGPSLKDIESSSFDPCFQAEARGEKVDEEDESREIWSRI
ncbi:hypothetical protein GEMRC1_003306 [Eukaryota sp. GEM-RC1]